MAMISPGPLIGLGSGGVDDDGYDAASDFGMDPLDPLEGMDEPDRFGIFMPAVQNLVNALGGYEEVSTPDGGFQTIYRPGDSVLAVLKDLKKLWRKDDSDDERTVARCMAKAGLMKELLALLVECTDRGEWGRKVGLVACDLIAALTWPIDVQQELRETDDEPDLVTDYVSLLAAQVEYKAMVVQTPGPLRCLLALLLPSLARPRKDERDEKVISLGLHIIRNLLAIRDVAADGVSAGEKEEFSHLQSRLIVQLNDLTFFRLILTLASCADKTEFNQYNVIVLDILYLTFGSIKPRLLAVDQKRAPMVKLEKLLDSERRTRALNPRTNVSRHSRFGTTIAVRAGKQKVILHQQNAVSADIGMMLDDSKKKRATRLKKSDELTHRAELHPDAIIALQRLAKQFLESCFNTFFASVLKDIRMERSKVRDTDNTRAFFLSRFFIEYLLLVREQAAAKSTPTMQGLDANPPAEGVESNGMLSLGYVAEMAEVETVRWLVGRMRITMDEKPPQWRELQACLDCFTQILMLIDAMSLSGEEEVVEIAEILQNRLYYNGDILDSALTVVSNYKDQSVAYLETIVNFAFVLLRMLERYSKNKSFMFIRKRKAARRKRLADKNGESQGPTAEEYAGDDEEGDGGDDRDAPSYAEHAFTFQTFEKRFANEAVVNTLLAYLARYRSFDEPEQLKRVVGLMHRQVIKTQAEGLYFKVTCLDLFRRILNDQASLLKADSTNDLLQLIKFILRKFFKRVSEDPFLIVQAFAPKTRGHWKELSSYKSDEDSDDEMGGQRSRIKEKLERSPTDLEFKKNKNLSWSEQMGTIIAILLQNGHRDWIEWVIEVLELVHAARTEIVLATDGPDATLNQEDDEDEDLNHRTRNFAGPSNAARDKFEQHDMDAGEDEGRMMALAKDAQFRLMLKLLAFDRTDEEKALEQRWFIPSSILPSQLSTSLGALRQYLTTPPTLTEEPKALLRRTRKRRSALSDDEEDQPKRIRKKKMAEVQVYKSAAFIEDSDDDEEADKAFFEREKALRAEMEETAKRQETLIVDNTEKKRKRTAKPKSGGSRLPEDEDSEDDMSRPGLSRMPDATQEESDASGSEDDEMMMRRTGDYDTSPSPRKSSQTSEMEVDSPKGGLLASIVNKVKKRRTILSDSDEDE